MSIIGWMFLPTTVKSCLHKFYVVTLFCLPKKYFVIGGLSNEQKERT